MARRIQRPSDDGGSILAATITIALGSVFCIWVVLVGAPVSQDWIIAAVGISAIVLIVSLMVFRYRRLSRPDLSFWKSMFGNHNDDGIAGQYRPEKLKGQALQSSNPTQKPITADEVRAIHENSPNTWVPTGANRKRSR